MTHLFLFSQNKIIYRIFYQRKILNQQQIPNISFFFMKINNLTYSQLNNALQSHQLLLDLSNKPNNQLFRTQKIFSAKTQRTLSKFDLKSRTLSSSCKKSSSTQTKTILTKKKNNQSQNKKNKSRPASCGSSIKRQKAFPQKQQILNRPRTATNRFYTGLELKKSNKKDDIFLQLSKQIKRYLSNVMSSQQKKETLQQLKLILNILQKGIDATSIILHLQRLQNQLSKFLKHRISHLYFYLIYYKFISTLMASKEDANKQLKILILCEYHSRTFMFRKIALLICMQIQQKYIKLNNYEESKRYAIKCLKLTVVLNERYYQMKMLQYLGVVKYYEGILNLNGSNILSEKQRINILRLYNEEQQIPRIFNFNDPNKKSNRNTHNPNKNGQNDNQNKLNLSEDQILSSYYDKNRLYFNQGQNFIVNNIPSTNLKKFNRNFHGIAKNLRKTVAVKQSIQKVNQVGQVKKFIAKDNYITLYPQANTIKNTFQNQVFITHKKYADLQKGNIFIKKVLPSIISKLQTLILTQIYQRTNLTDQKND